MDILAFLSDPNVLAATLFLTMILLMPVGYHLAFLGRQLPDYERVKKQKVSSSIGRQIMLISYFYTDLVGQPLVRRGISPDTVSFVSMLFGAAAGIALGFSQFGFGAVLFFCSGFLDVVDGIVARGQKSSTAGGAVIDSTFDRYVDFFVLAGIAVHYRDNILMLILTLFAILGSYMISYSSAKAEAMNVEPPRGGMKRTERGPLLVLGATLSAFTVPAVEAGFGLPASFGLPMALLVGYIAIFANVSAIKRLRYLIRNA
jgi:CDP-diacylglycerol---glycerol-3-phosphate 3-phosphatidyltransferase